MNIEYWITLLVGIGIAVWLFLYLRRWSLFLSAYVKSLYRIDEALTYEWQFLDQILLRVEQDQSICDVFNYLDIKSLDDKRVAIFAMLMVEISSLKGSAQTAMLTKQLASAHRSLIQSFPEEYRGVYNNALEIVLSEKVVVITDGSIVVLDKMSKEDSAETQKFIDEFCDWSDVIVPQDRSVLKKRIKEMSPMITTHRFIFRFKKNPVRGNRRPKRKIASLRPVLGLTPSPR